MFDPRSDIEGLFTNNRIGASSRYSNTDVYVKVLTMEDNEEKEPNDYGDKYVGIIWLKPPRAYLRDMDIGFNTTEHEVVIDCDFILPKNERWLKGNHTTFINTILNTFETTIRTNCSASGKSWDIAMFENIPISFDNNPNVYRRVSEIVCYKAN